MKLIKTIKSNINNGPNIAILGCVHGDETYSLKVFKRLRNINLLMGKIDFYLVNEKAFEKNKRFIDIDLNRSFDMKGNSYEIDLAKVIVEELKGYDYIIDMHSTKSKTNPFLIYVNKNLINSDFINSFNIKKRVYVPNSNFSLISQFKNAVAIEISVFSNQKLAIRKGTKYIISFLSSFNLISKNNNVIKKIENYICVGKMEKSNNLTDFKLTKVDNEYIYPMLSGEVEFEHLFCFKLKKY